jgi:hypothetical protein
VDAGQKVSVHIPGFAVRTGTIASGRLCGLNRQAYRVKIDGVKTPWTVHKSFLKKIAGSEE